MQGYRVYFDGEKFVVESEPSTVECKTMPYDSTVSWCGGPDIAFIVAREQNELIQKGQWTVQACKNCGGYFLLTHAEITWFQEHGMKSPRRCMACRKERKNEQRRG